jgi:hypothetical protein
MPLSQAAMDGITANGHGWKHHISLGGQTEIMGKMTEGTPEQEGTPDAEVEACARAIVGHVRTFAIRIAADHSDLATWLLHEAEQLEEVADCGLDEVRHAMSSLYDEFDFQRICVVK